HRPKKRGYGRGGAREQAQRGRPRAREREPAAPPGPVERALETLPELASVCRGRRGPNAEPWHDQNAEEERARQHERHGEGEHAEEGARHAPQIDERDEDRERAEARPRE